MRSAAWLLGYFVLKVVVLLCDAAGEPGRQLSGFVMMSGSNDSRDGENGLTETPHIEDRCRGYYDVMGQWDPPFVCRTGSYLYCCGTCGFRFCCAFKSSRLDQNTCKNYDTPMWMMTGRPPSKKNDPAHDPTKDKTNLIVYIVCGVVAIMALVGIFTKLGLEKAHRPHRENMTRALANVMRQPGSCPAEPMEREEGLGVHVQHYENLHARVTVNSFHGAMNSLGPTPTLVPTMTQPHPYATLGGPLTHTYNQPPLAKELNKYASLKAVAEKANDNFYVNRRHLTDLTTKGSLPLHPVRLQHNTPPFYAPEPLVAPPAPLPTPLAVTLPTPLPTPLPAPLPMSIPKQNGHKPRVVRAHGPPPLAYASHTIASPGMMKGWSAMEASATLGPRSLYAPRKHCTMERSGQLYLSRSQHYLPPHPYFVTNSKTEVTV
ncbi:protein shisa-9B [Brienomyrus brachyistius]|uniref:protein shisa-9B n=1 Tax=Brienomyrus brachyistius TaxID=42636 RepID=UPI0020B344FC|nr:protein shisa-9B [Brienomyrus brachyistius]